MGLFSFFKRDKKKSKEELALHKEELERQYEAELDPSQVTSDAPSGDTPSGSTPPPEDVPQASIETPPQTSPEESPVAPPSPEPQAQVASPEERDEASESEAPAEKPKTSFFGKLTNAMSKTRLVLKRRVAGVIGLGQKIDDDLLDELEEALIEADIGVESTEMLIEDIRRAWKNGDIETGDDIFPFIKADLKHRLTRGSSTLASASQGPTVILVVGVNGAGKTTSIAKLSWILTQEKRRVLLAAGDTFRAAAVEQLVTWSKRIGCEIVTGAPGADPASVAYQGCERAVKEDFDVLIIDTAGRLHTQKNLMDELGKIHKVIGKVIPDGPHETILVLDATTGQNAIQQAKMFGEVAGVSGLFLSKLDGTAKGGAILTIDRQIGIPVKFVGLGESFEDIQRFNAAAFVDALFDESDLVPEVAGERS